MADSVLRIKSKEFAKNIRIRKGVKVSLWAACGIATALLISLCVLLCMGFRFSSKAAVHEYYRAGTVIHTDAYDFYLNPVDGENTGGYSEGHATVKKYGFLYRQIKSDDSKHRERQILVAANRETVGYMYSYPTDEKVYRLIHWEQEFAGIQGDATQYSMKYWTDEILLNGQTVKLENTCFFITEEPIETLIIKGTSVFVVNGLSKGDYWNDESIMIINTESDVDAERIKAHYDGNGIIVVRDPALSNDVQGIIKGATVPEGDEKDLAVVYYKNKYGTSVSSILQGNTSDPESEIDAMVADAKGNQ